MSLRAIGNAIDARLEVATRAGEFTTLAKAFAAAKGDPVLAARMCKVPRLVEILEKSAITAGGLADPANMGSIAPYGSIVSAFLSSLRNSSAFDGMLPVMRKVPLRARAVAITVGITGATVGASQVKPISQLQLVGSVVEPAKATAIVVLTNELWRRTDEATAAMFAAELRAGVAVATDQQFIALITTGATSFSSAGSTAAAFSDDLANALRAISTDAQSRLFMLMSSNTVKGLITLDSNGPPVFPELSVSGGRIFGIDIIITDGLPADDTVVLVDANAIAANSDTASLSTSTTADIQFQTTPDSPPSAATELQSLWQHDMTGLMVERYFGATLLRSTGAVVLTSCHYGSGNSP